jgi:pimeloyl-ACP methyl ester carboxylesterase
MPGIDITDWLPKISAPTLVIAGTKDPIVPPAQAELIAKHVPNSQLVMLEGSGHVPMFERPEEYIQAVTRWLEHSTDEGE